MGKLDSIISIAGVISTLLAAYWWFRASLIQVPDNIDTFIGVLQRIGK